MLLYSVVEVLPLASESTSTHSCPSCSATFSSTALLGEHVANHRVPRRGSSKHRANIRDRQFKCLQCWKAFETEDKLRRHTLTHSEAVKPFACDVSRCFRNCCRLYLLVWTRLKRIRVSEVASPCDNWTGEILVTLSGIDISEPSYQVAIVNKCVRTGLFVNVNKTYLDVSMVFFSLSMKSLSVAARCVSNDSWTIQRCHVTWRRTVETNTTTALCATRALIRSTCCVSTQRDTAIQLPECMRVHGATRVLIRTTLRGDTPEFSIRKPVIRVRTVARRFHGQTNWSYISSSTLLTASLCAKRVARSLNERLEMHSLL